MPVLCLFHISFFYQGRLDADSSGLLLFSSNGEVTSTLLAPATGVEREYVAHVAGSVEFDSLKQTLEAGVQTSDGVYKAELLEASQLTGDVSTHSLKMFKIV